MIDEINRAVVKLVDELDARFLIYGGLLFLVHCNSCNKLDRMAEALDKQTALMSRCGVVMPTIAEERK